MMYISIHALREEGDLCTCKVAFTSSISIHALREEGDGQQPHRGGGRGISIHALREEGDTGTGLQLCDRAAFLSTPSARRATLLL